MKKFIHLISLILLPLNIGLAQSVEIYTLDQLDEYRGYCLDIRGYKLKAKPNNGLQAHTCYSYQGKVAVDQGFDALKLTKNQFFLPAFGVCMEAISIAAITKIQLSNCGTGKFQEFKLDEKGRIRLVSNLKLCLTVAQGQSKEGGGGSPVHLMRNLSLELCNEILNSFQNWGVRK